MKVGGGGIRGIPWDVGGGGWIGVRIGMMLEGNTCFWWKMKGWGCLRQFRVTSFLVLWLDEHMFSSIH